MSESVSKESGPDRFQIAVDGQVAGFTRFVDHEGLRVFFHTEIGEAFGGRGLAGIVVKAALDATRVEGLRLVAVCPFVKKYVERHREYDDILAKATPGALAAIPR